MAFEELLKVRSAKSVGQKAAGWSDMLSVAFRSLSIVVYQRENPCPRRTGMRARKRIQNSVTAVYILSQVPENIFQLLQWSISRSSVRHCLQLGGQPATCAELTAFCSHETHGVEITTTCPQVRRCAALRQVQDSLSHALGASSHFRLQINVGLLLFSSLTPGFDAENLGRRLDTPAAVPADPGRLPLL